MEKWGQAGIYIIGHLVRKHVQGPPYSATVMNETAWILDKHNIKQNSTPLLQNSSEAFYHLFASSFTPTFYSHYSELSKVVNNVFLLQPA